MLQSAARRALLYGRAAARLSGRARLVDAANALVAELRRRAVIDADDADDADADEGYMSADTDDELRSPTTHHADNDDAHGRRARRAGSVGGDSSR